MGRDQWVQGHRSDECSHYLTAEGKLLMDRVWGRVIGV